MISDLRSDSTVDFFATISDRELSLTMPTSGGIRDGEPVSDRADPNETERERRRLRALQRLSDRAKAQPRGPGGRFAPPASEAHWPRQERTPRPKARPAVRRRKFKATVPVKRTAGDQELERVTEGSDEDSFHEPVSSRSSQASDPAQGAHTPRAGPRPSFHELDLGAQGNGAPVQHGPVTPPRSLLSSGIAVAGLLARSPVAVFNKVYDVVGGSTEPPDRRDGCPRHHLGDSHRICGDACPCCVLHRGGEHGCRRCERLLEERLLAGVRRDADLEKPLPVPPVELPTPLAPLRSEPPTPARAGQASELPSHGNTAEKIRRL